MERPLAAKESERSTPIPVGLTRIRFLFQTALPIARFATVVRDSKDSDLWRGFEVEDVIGEALHCKPAHRQFCWKAWHPFPSSRQIGDLADCGIDGVEELQAKADPAVLVPTAGIAVLSIGLVFESNEGVHRLRNSASARRRTSSQAIPGDSPAITRRARRSISAAHAASTSATSSVPESSKLANSSAATSARSSTGSDNASRRSSCALEVMWPF